jgi:hypothetical protein
MKDAYYFSHDSNASNDPKIIAMRSVYGTEGYGRYWLLIEMMREADGYKLEIKSKYAFNAYAEHLKCDCNAFASFLHDCIHEFQLFSSDESYFWSESLFRRMLKANEKSEKARQSAEARWNKQPKNANASKKQANAPKIDALKERKGKENKEKILPLINFNKITYQKDQDIELVESYLNLMDFEVLEDAIIRSKGKDIRYLLKTLGNIYREGNTKKESIVPRFTPPNEQEAINSLRRAEEAKNQPILNYEPEYMGVGNGTVPAGSN